MCTGNTHGMDATCYDQHLLDTIFNDLEHLLAEKRPAARSDDTCCISCGGNELSYSSSNSSYPGSYVCDYCGAVQPGSVIYEQMFGKNLPVRSSNYKRIHHWHERISQLLLMESQIPHPQMLRIAEKLCDGTHTLINKDTVRSVLRSLGLQLYIEKWLQIIFRVTKIAPPIPGSLLICKLDSMFQELQEPFSCFRVNKRKNFLNYNYVFCRLFQRLKCKQFCMFFPLIKSKQKLRQLDDMWAKMASCLKWEITPLEAVDPFAVRLVKPELLLQQLASEYVPPVLAVPQIEMPKMVFRTLDRRFLNKLPLQKAQRRSSQLVRVSQKAAVAKRHRLSGTAKRLLSQSRRRCLVLHEL